MPDRPRSSWLCTSILVRVGSSYYCCRCARARIRPRATDSAALAFRPMGLLPSFSSVVQQAVILGAFVSLSKRAGLITVHTRALKNEHARRAFEAFVSTSDWAVTSVESLLGAKRR